MKPAWPIGHPRDFPPLASEWRKRVGICGAARCLEARWGLKMWDSSPDAPAPYRRLLALFDRLREREKVFWQDWKQRSFGCCAPALRAFIRENGGSVTFTHVNTKFWPTRNVGLKQPDDLALVPGVCVAQTRVGRGHRVELAGKT